MSVPPTDPLVVFLPSGRRGRFPLGTPILDAARALGVDLDSVCGGRGVCGRCQVTPCAGNHPKLGIAVAADALSPVGERESFYARRRGLADGRRLGCAATVQGDLVVEVPPESQVHRPVVRKDADERPVHVDPVVRLHAVAVEEPDMHRPSGDVQRLTEALRAQWGLDDLSIEPAALALVQPVLRAGSWTVTAAVREDRRIVHLWPGVRTEAYGLAVDVGSTTIAVHLTNLSDGSVLAAAGGHNPQVRFGEDVMSRVSHLQLNPGTLGDMTACVREAITRLAAETAKTAGITLADVVEVTLVGNPIMHHLLLGIHPGELGGAPFALTTNEAITLPARDLGLAVAPGAQAYVLPCVAGHVGADAAAAMLAEAPWEHDDLSLIIDVGTNAEIILGNRDRLLACSSPTGPAFEGGEISCGQRAAPGAIERVRIDRATLEPRFKVIGVEPWSDEPGFPEAVAAVGITGLCGSGIVEAIAELFLAGAVTRDGVIAAAAADRSGRIVSDGRTWAYVLHAGEPEIRITQRDLRAIQLAKAALQAGARLLLERVGRTAPDRITLTGGFGSHIDPFYAMVLGMVPDCAMDRIRAIGNAAGQGARIALVNRTQRGLLERMVRRVEKIETAVEPGFQTHFVEAMALPHASAPYPNLTTVVALPTPPPPANPSAGGRRRRARLRA